MERLVFHILQDGTVEETVSGVKGSSCLDLTEKIDEMEQRNKIGLKHIWIILPGMRV